MPDLYAPAIALAAVFSAAAIFFDLRERRIPNLLNYSFLVLAVVLAFLAEKLDFNYVLFVALSFGFAFILYKLGAWAGGDAKFFTALSAFFGVVENTAPQSIVVVFLASAALLIPVLVALQLREFAAAGNEFLGAFKASFKPALSSALLSTALYAAYSLVFSRLEPRALAAAAAAGFAIAFAVFFFKSFFGIVSQKILRKRVRVSELREGEIPAESVYKKHGRIVFWQPPSPGTVFSRLLKFGPNALRELLPPPNPIASALAARGVSAGEIKQLKKEGVKSLVVKRSVAFAPALAAGFAVTGLLV